MKIDAGLIKKLREERAWPQEHLASVAGVSLRTIQRVESEGVASLDTRMALAAAFNVPAASLMPGAVQMPSAAETVPGATGGRRAVLAVQVLWAAAIIATALETKSVVLTVIVLPALAMASLAVMDRSTRRRRCTMGRLGG
jgi:transcriptional regulator with XRE-family HTH domain